MQTNELWLAVILELFTGLHVLIGVVRVLDLAVFIGNWDKTAIIA